MPLLPVTPPAGVVTNGTDYANKGRWTDSDLVRFQNGYLRPLGGWEKIKTTALSGTPTGMFAYITNNGSKVLVVGTRQKIYVRHIDTWYDITPSGFVTDESTDPLGFGAYNYNVEDYGDARSQSGLFFDSKSWSFANWGEDLLFCCASDGKIYKWSPSSPATIGSQLTNSPISCAGVLVLSLIHI